MLSIRPAVADEWFAIRRILEDAQLPTDDLDAHASRWFWLACEGSNIQGVIALEPLAKEGAILRSLAVESHVRRRGIGRALVENAEAHAREQHVQRIYLLTTTAEKFFSALGYQRLERAQAPENIRAHPQFRSLCPGSAVLMQKALV